MNIARSLLLSFALAPAALMAQSVYTIPQGYMNFTIPAGSAGTPSVSTFSLPLSAPVPGNFVGQSAGTITSITANTITNSAAGWTAGALSQASSPWFIRIMSGTAVGRTLQVTSAQASTATTVTVDNQGTDLTTLGIVSGDKYELFPAYTLQSVFGNSVLGGASAGAADVVRLHNGTGWVEYYYNTTASQWRIGSLPVSQNNVVIRPDSGVIFYRRSSSPLVLTLVGKVPSTDLQVVMNEVGAAFIGGFPNDSTLAGNNCNTMPGWVNNTGSVVNADKVTAFVSGAWNSYNYNQSAGQWRNGSVPVNQGSVALAAGTPFIIESPTGTPGLKVWKRTLPYSLSAN